jgi:hypothetical protein
MLAEANGRARELSIDDPVRTFYAGVETAALHALHPLAHVVHGDDRSWLCVESGPFQAGYLKATTVLTAAEVTADENLRVPLPDPPS